MDEINQKLDLILKSQDNLNQKIDTVKEELTQRIDKVEERLYLHRFENLEKFAEMKKDFQKLDAKLDRNLNEISEIFNNIFSVIDKSLRN